MNVKDYITNKGIAYNEVIRQTGLNYITICPFCNGGEKNEKSFAINATTGYWNCFRKNNCGLSGTFYQLQERLGDKPEKINNNKQTIGNQSIQYRKPNIIKLNLNDECLDYLKNERKFTQEIINQFHLFGSIQSEICFPYYKNSDLINVKYRSLDKKFRSEKNCNQTLFNIDNVDITNDILVITEGEFDCMALVQYGISNVVSLPGGVNNLKWIDTEWDFINNFKNIFLSLDMDEAGQNSVLKLVTRLGDWRCKNILLPFKDANECLQNNVSPEVILECFEHPQEFSPTELKTAGNFKDQVIDIIQNPGRYTGIETGIPELTDILGGWRSGELTIWSGQSGSGKSTLVNQICLFLASREIKTCIASLELKPQRYLRWTICQILGADNHNTDDISSAFDWINKYMYVIDIDDEINPDKLFDLFKYCAMRYGVEHFVIDSLMRITLTGDENLSQKEFTKKCSDFAKRFDIHCHLIAHPRKQESDNSKPGKTDVKGSGDITNVADNVIIIWRNIIDCDDQENDISSSSVLYVRKNREFGDLRSLKLQFDKKFKRFTCFGQNSIFY